jgi:hypothetical protein
MVGTQQTKQVFQVVGPWHSQPQFDQEGLQEFLRSLLTTEANKITFRPPASGEFLCDAVIGLGLPNPIGR